MTLRLLKAMKWYSKILYAPIGWALHLLALMPWWVLYLHADAIYFLVYHVIGYRTKVVRQNLNECFPGKTEQERRAIEKEFYHHFADYFVETIKLLHISDDDMRRRMVFHNAQLIDKAFDNNQSVVLYAAHYGNWEWVTSITLWFDSRAHSDAVQGQVYQPLENEWFDNFSVKPPFQCCTITGEKIRLIILNFVKIVIIAFCSEKVFQWFAEAELFSPYIQHILVNSHKDRGVCFCGLFP